MKKSLSLLICLLLAPLAAQELTIDQIMEGPDFVGVSPSQVRWSGDSEHIFFQWRQPGEKKAGTYVIQPDGSGLRRLSEDEDEEAWPASGTWNEDRTLLLTAIDGDVYLYSNDGSRRAVIKTTAFESNPQFTRDEKRIVFESNDNLYTLSLTGSVLHQVTDFRQGSAPSDPELTASQKYLKAQQEQLFEEFSGDKKADREEAEAERKERDKRAFHIKQGDSVSGMSLSPDERRVVFRLSSRVPKAKRTMVPDFVTGDGYTTELNAREKVGDEQPDQKLGIYSVDTGEVTWVEKPAATSSMIGPRWNDEGDRAALWLLSKDFKDRWIVTLDLDKGEIQVVDQLHDDAWVGGPLSTTFGWMPDGESLYFVSERDGWAHLYTVPAQGGEATPLTSGAWEVTWLRLSRDETTWYLVTSELDLGQRHLYRMPLRGGERIRLTGPVGNHDVELSPDDQHWAILYSSATTPAELYYLPNQSGASWRPLTESTPPTFREHPWREPEYVRFQARDGAQVPARLYRPEMAAEGRPAVIFVHGAGYLQNAHKWWSSYYREYMFHHILTSKGYHVLDIDYRGSAGYGRDWRTGIYRHMGGKDLSDQVDGARWLIEKHGVDPGRVGIYGGSYGGFITLMAMFTEPDIFAAGAALRPVTDWAHYNHGYTARILNSPQDDPEAYSRSSPIHFAEGLKGALLMCHGMVDTNVHFQDSVRLAQKLIELRKENWELAVYPVEGHGFDNSSSWADEYKRILKLFEEHLK